MRRQYAEPPKRRRPSHEVAPLTVRDYEKLKDDLREAAELADTTLKTYADELRR